MTRPPMLSPDEFRDLARELMEDQPGDEDTTYIVNRLLGAIAGHHAWEYSTEEEWIELCRSAFRHALEAQAKVLKPS